MFELQTLDLEGPERTCLLEKQSDDIPIIQSSLASVLQSPIADHGAGLLSLQRRLAEIYPDLVRQEGFHV